MPPWKRYLPSTGTSVFRCIYAMSACVKRIFRRWRRRHLTMSAPVVIRVKRVLPISSSCIIPPGNFAGWPYPAYRIARNVGRISVAPPGNTATASAVAAASFRRYGDPFAGARYRGTKMPSLYALQASCATFPPPRRGAHKSFQSLKLNQQLSRAFGADARHAGDF